MAAIEGARFGHVNVTSADWRRLASFYTDLFGCELVPPERDYRGGDLEAATRVPGAHLTSDGRQVTWCYATDPDGNIFELQAWS